MDETQIAAMWWLGFVLLGMTVAGMIEQAWLDRKRRRLSERLGRSIEQIKGERS